MFDCRPPKNKQEFEQYYHLRWKMLREPWKQPLGSEKDELEQQSIHRAIFDGKGNILAVGRLTITQGWQANIRFMAVDVNAQGKGLGKVIVESLEQAALERGVNRISLHAREVAVTFYRKLGYTLKEKSHLLFGEVQHFSMDKELTPEGFALNESVHLLQKTWHETIPLSNAMGLVIDSYNIQSLVTHADIQFNKNLHNTMFAGSIYTLATLTGWGWIYLELAANGLEADIVLAQGNIEYLAPIPGAANGYAVREQCEGDCKKLVDKSKCKYKLQVQIMSGDIVAAVFSGQYVLVRK